METMMTTKVKTKKKIKNKHNKHEVEIRDYCRKQCNNKRLSEKQKSIIEDSICNIVGRTKLDEIGPIKILVDIILKVIERNDMDTTSFNLLEDLIKALGPILQYISYGLNLESVENLHLVNVIVTEFFSNYDFDQQQEDHHKSQKNEDRENGNKRGKDGRNEKNNHGDHDDHIRIHRKNENEEHENGNKRGKDGRNEKKDHGDHDDKKNKHSKHEKSDEEKNRHNDIKKLVESKCEKCERCKKNPWILY